MCAWLRNCPKIKTALTKIDHISLYTHAYNLPKKVSWKSSFRNKKPFISLYDTRLSSKILGSIPIELQGLNAASYDSHQRYLSVESGSLIYEKNFNVSIEEFQKKVNYILDDLGKFNKIEKSHIKKIAVSGGVCILGGAEFLKSYSYGYDQDILKADWYLWNQKYMLCKTEENKNNISWFLFTEHRAKEQKKMIDEIILEVTSNLKLK